MKTWLGAAGMAAMIAVGAFSPTRASAACGNQNVYVFDAYWCPYCKLVKEFLARNNIPYRSIDTTNSARVRAYMAQRFNTTAIPVTVIDDAYVIGFNEPLLRQLLCL
jgi:glutaredoxin